ncbi:hypothetical protein LVJ82_00845 [Vitreoscilla massiliensis]|uniref:Acyl carrier protein n=1 Tax=Vitreoscilla massiliensis TaxID=1689272 RepID=A0ABY4DZW5_9NEIS|nr:hypothetical protein [Vitreoscilla massiliensis]UOO89081.1 hypothetical protein LVJ82_16815 [Vitreoscilla massiliensis]UOO89563.1 hypothetical protein LVJ82_00845 [Vitreoscilla massiliensis]
MIPSEVKETLLCALQTELNLIEESKKVFELDEFDLQTLADVKRAREWLEQQEVEPCQTQPE